MDADADDAMRMMRCNAMQLYSVIDTKVVVDMAKLFYCLVSISVVEFFLFLRRG